MKRKVTHAAVAGIVGAGLGLVSAAASLGIATFFARKIITPEHQKPDDVSILAVDLSEMRVTFQANAETLAPGRYGVWTAGGQGHFRVGEVLSTDASSRRLSEHRVTRELLGVDAGEVTPGPARWNAYFYSGDPRSALGLDFSNILVSGDLGGLPTWHVPPQELTEHNNTWAILVHGRSARRAETLRAVPVLHQQGFQVLVPMYRNDEGAPSSIDGRYNLGLSEWRDIESVMEFALSQGAKDIVLFGWSMGGSTVLQTLDRSRLSALVSAVVLDGPVIDWGDVITYQAQINRLPWPADSLAKMLLSQRFSRSLVGVAEPIDIGVTNWVQRSDELRHPFLLIHSNADHVVPYGPSRALAAARPDLVTFAEWEHALHCREWNTDSGRWEALVSEFVATDRPLVGSATSGRHQR